ncbi:MAG: M48 family metalloprotease [Gammaproteobacteria bacterium]|nr:M48 family metalloprotease [Gammaproteobacteria bacterium]
MNRLLPPLLLLSCLLLSACATNPVSGRQNFVMMSTDKEVRTGAQMHPQIVQQYGLYNNQALQKYVDRVGQELARVSHRPELNYRFTLLDSPVINAFALPGGYIYITRGLLIYLNSVDQLAAVLGHELGHVTARHSVQQQAAAGAANIGYTIGSILVPGLGSAGVSDLFNVVSTGILRGYGRDHELEADRLGAIYLARAGYEPEAMIDVIRVLKDQDSFAAERAKAEGREHQGYHGLFSTHPDNDDRLHNVVGTAAALAEAGPRKGLDKSFLSRLDGLVFGDSSHQGIRRNNSFYHKSLDIRVQFPDQWTLENSAKQLTARAPEGSAVMIMLSDTRPENLTPLQYITNTMKLKPLAGHQSLDIKNSPGASIQTKIPSRSGIQVGRVSVRYLGETAYIFLGVPKDQNQLSTYDSEFLEAARSLRRLTPAEAKLAAPLQVHLITANSHTRISQLAEGSAITNYPEAQLRLLNQLYPDREPVPGQTLKIIR